MKNLKVTEYRLAEFKDSYPQLLYTKPEFLEANNDLPQIHFYLVETESDLILGHVGFSLEESRVYSPFKAPFGGFSLNENLEGVEVCFFVLEVLRRLKVKSVFEMELKLPPLCYGENYKLLSEYLTFLGFEVSKQEAYQAIPVQGAGLEQLIASMEKRRLRKCIEAGFRFQVLPDTALHQVFDFVRLQRATKGYDFSMNWEALKLIKRSEPSAYVPMAIFDKGKIVAATIGIWASEIVLYNFCPAHDLEYDKFSPVVQLTQGLYEYAASKGALYVDLGTSYLETKPNESLRTFKEHLGAQYFYSCSYRKALSSH